MRILADTNVLVWHTAEKSQAQRAINERLSRSLSASADLCIAPQNLYEFWVVATRPLTSNGLGLAPSAARSLVDPLLEAYSLLADPEGLVGRWLDLCVRYEVRGRAAHDARLVAWMQGHGIRHLITLDAGDFKRYEDVECLVPGVDRPE